MNSAICRFAILGLMSGIATSAMATEVTWPTSFTSHFPLSLLSFSGGNDRSRYEIAPNWSRKLGWSLKGAFGSYMTNDLALGAIVEHGQGKREYLTNAGFRLSNGLRLVGSVGMLEERREFTTGAGKETVQQMHYGASLKGEHNIGMLHGFELNGYLAVADADSNGIETGRLYGAQVLTALKPTDAISVRLGVGQEWLRQNDGEYDNSLTFRADGIQKITDKLSATVNVNFGAAEFSYGGGLNYNFGDRSNANVIRISFASVEGKNGIQDDQRVELVWKMGLSVAPSSAGSSHVTGSSSKSHVMPFDAGISSSTDTLLADVMKRPEFLPSRVLAKEAESACRRFDPQIYEASGVVGESRILFRSSIALVNDYSAADMRWSSSSPELNSAYNYMWVDDHSFYQIYANPIQSGSTVTVTINANPTGRFANCTFSRTFSISFP